MILLVLLIALELIISPKSVLAISPPTQTSPSNGATVSSSKLTWDTPSYSLYSNDPYRIQVDNDSDFLSVYRDYKTKNTFYTPVLTEGKWYWKIKAEDASGTWSDWSNVWSFTLSTSIPSLTPTPTPAPSSTTSSTSSQSTSSFIISNIPSQINSDQPFSVSVSLSLPNNPSSNFYLKGAFKTSDGSNYFGLTKVGSSWVKNGNAYSAQFPITTDSSGNWSGNLEMQPDSSDSGFIGTSDYIFKVGRYSTSGSGPTWSNGQTIKIIGESNSNSSGSSSSNSSNSSTTPTSSPKNPTTKTASITNSTVKINNKIASIAGKATSSATNSATQSAASSAEVKAQKQIFLSWIGGLFILSGISSLIYMYLRAKKNA